MPQGSDSSAVSLESFVASAFDGPWAAGTDETPESAAPPASETVETPGAPPVEPAPDASDQTAEPEGDETDQGDTDPAAQPSPDPAAPAATPETEPDLLANAQVLTYRVNGQERSFDDFKVIPGYGAIITDAALPKLQQRLSERDSLYERSQQHYQQYTDLERLTAWKTVGPDGKEQILTGAAGLQARDLALEKANAVLNTIAQAFDNPELFRSLIAVDPRTQELIPDPRAIEYLTTKAQLSAANAERSVQQRYQQASTPQSQAPQAPDLQAAAPALVDHFAQTLGVSVAAEDKGFLESMLPQFVRPATQEDVRLTPTLTVGELVIDAKFGQLLQQQAQLRASTAKTVQHASEISKENAARLAAAAAGKTQVKSHLRTAPQPRQQPQRDQRAQDADDAFTLMQSLAAGRFPTAGA